MSQLVHKIRIGQHRSNKLPCCLYQDITWPHNTEYPLYS